LHADGGTEGFSLPLLQPSEAVKENVLRDCSRFPEGEHPGEGKPLPAFILSEQQAVLYGNFEFKPNLGAAETVRMIPGLDKGQYLR